MNLDRRLSHVPNRDAYKYFPETLHLFLLHASPKSRPNTPPRVISQQILVRRVASGFLLIFDRTLDRRPKRRVLRRLPKVSPTCNVRAEASNCQFEYKAAHCYAHFNSTHQGLSSIALRFLLDACAATFDNTTPRTRSRCSDALSTRRIGRARRPSRARSRFVSIRS